MRDKEDARYLIEQIIAGGSGSNIPITYTEDEGIQADMFLNMSGDGNDEPEHRVDNNAEQNLDMTEGFGERNKPRGRTKIMEGRLHITEVKEEGKPIAPEYVARKFMSEIRAMVRDNVPINIKQWKGRQDDPYVLPWTQKDMLWADVKKQFTLAEGVKEKDNSFVEYKMSEGSANKVHVNVPNASKKECHHCLGRCGYITTIPKWRKMEQDLFDRGIYYAHGGNLSQEDETLMFNETIRQKAKRLIKNIEDAKVAKLKGDRENNELTLALGNPEHPEHWQGYGIVPWKFTFHRDIDSYRSCKKKFIQVAKVVTEMAQSGALQDPNIVNPSHRRSSCASTMVPDEHMTRLPVDNQRYPVDDITQCTSGELHRPFGNITIKVAYGSALPILQGVGLERIVDSQYEGLELDLPGGDGERTLGDVLHAIILWLKRYIIIPGMEASLLPVDPPDDDHNTPPRSPLPGVRPAVSKELAAPLKKPRPPPSKLRQPKKTKKSKPIQKLPADMTTEELREISQATVKEFFKNCAEQRKAKEMEPKPLDPAKLKFFIGMSKEVKRTIVSNYEHSLVKSDEKKKWRGASSSSRTVPQLRDLPDKDTQTIQAVPLEQQIKVIGFMQDTSMSLAEVLGQFEPLAPKRIVPKWLFEVGKPLVRPELVQKLSTKMYEFHEWYIEQSANERLMFALQVKPIDFFGEGEKLLWIEFKDIYKVYHQDALDISLISAWVMMLIQRCHRESYFNVGFMDPSLVNQAQIRDQPKKTLKAVYNFLDKQNYKEYILLPYNFNFHWILLIIMIDRSHVIVYNSLREPPAEYQDIQYMLNSAWKRFLKTHYGDFKEKLTLNTKFPCLGEEQGNNLCGYYVCENMNSFVHGKLLSSHDLDMWKIQERLLEKQRIFAICEGLIGFLVDEVINPVGEFYYDGRSIAARATPQQDDPRNKVDKLLYI
uniref:Ubiquitin-like protease family profile domain-containing protein n=1 Tax=Setaria viridis TaxID=4556 RepID=A0A4U6VUB4_SETVI|nr:hypothetical protein SEVIR_3G317300v2 [Setaria viridis]